MSPATTWLTCPVFSSKRLFGYKGLEGLVVDVEGGNAQLWVTPSGESVLVDTGNAGAAAVRDADRIMAAVKSKDTTPELVVRRLVHSLGYRYRLHVRSLPGTPDLVFPRLRKIINVNGCFWHGHSCRDGHLPKSAKKYWPKKLLCNKRRDALNDGRLRRMGWRLVVVWECRCASRNCHQHQNEQQEQHCLT